MSIYIKGMEMPTNCFECKLLDYADTFKCRFRFESLTREHGINISRPDWCPLIPVPEHGRLIDADAFSAKITEIVERQKYDDFYTQSLSVGAILREVVNELRGEGLDGFANAPTIIPASGGSGNE